MAPSDPTPPARCHLCGGLASAKRWIVSVGMRPVCSSHAARLDAEVSAEDLPWVFILVHS